MSYFKTKITFGLLTTLKCRSYGKHRSIYGNISHSEPSASQPPSWLIWWVSCWKLLILSDQEFNHWSFGLHVGIWRGCNLPLCTALVVGHFWRGSVCWDLKLTQFWKKAVTEKWLADLFLLDLTGSLNTFSKSLQGKNMSVTNTCSHDIISLFHFILIFFAFFQWQSCDYFIHVYLFSMIYFYKARFFSQCHWLSVCSVCHSFARGLRSLRGGQGECDLYLHKLQKTSLLWTPGPLWSNWHGRQSSVICLHKFVWNSQIFKSLLYHYKTSSVQHHCNI